MSTHCNYVFSLGCRCKIFFDFIKKRCFTIDKPALYEYNDYRWVTLPRDYDKEEFARIQAAAKKIQKQSQFFSIL